MTNSKEMHGEYIYYDDDEKIVKIEWYSQKSNLQMLGKNLKIQ